MRLNLASGLHPSSGLDVDHDVWVDVDLPWEGVDHPHVFGNGFALPFRDAAFDAAYVGHVLEHVEYGDVAAVLLELKRVLARGAVVAVVGPDIDKAEATDQPEHILRAIDTLSEGFGGHKWVATEALTVGAMWAVFPDARACPVSMIDQPAWPNPSTAPWQCAVLAHA